MPISVNPVEPMVSVWLNQAMPTFGDAIRNLREGLRLSQDDLARKAGVSRSLIQAAEKSPTPGSMRGANYRAIAEALDKTVLQLDAMWDKQETHPRSVSRARYVKITDGAYQIAIQAAKDAGKPMERWVSDAVIAFANLKLDLAQMEKRQRGGGK